MALIDTTYFVGEIELPNVDRKINSITSALDRYEKEVLLCLLGRTLYDTFIAGSTGGVAGEPIYDLIHGANFSFVFDGHTVNEYWPGLINDDKDSLIAYYCYYKIRKKDHSILTSVGEVKGKPENATRYDDMRKIVNSWRLFLKSYGELIYSIDGINLNTGLEYLRFDKRQGTYDFYNDWPSAYNFINSRRDEFPGWEFTIRRNINELGL